MKKKLLSIMAMLAIALTCGIMVACNSDDDTDEGGNNGTGGSSIDVTQLVGYTFYQRNKEIENDTFYEILLTSSVFATVHSYGRDLTDEGWESWDNGRVDCIYRIVGNKLTVYYDNNKGLVKEFVINFKNGEPIDWSRGDENIYANMSAEEKELYSYLFEVANPQSGDQSMFGFYLLDSWEYDADLASAASAGDLYFLDNWDNYYEKKYGGLGLFGLLITDENTIHFTSGSVKLKQSNAEGIVFLTKTYNVPDHGYIKNYTAYFYYKTDKYLGTSKYVISGDKLLLSDGTFYTIKGNKLVFTNYDWNGNSFEDAYVKQ